MDKNRGLSLVAAVGNLLYIYWLKFSPESLFGFVLCDLFALGLIWYPDTVGTAMGALFAPPYNPNFDDSWRRTVKLKVFIIAGWSFLLIFIPALGWFLSEMRK